MLPTIKPCGHKVLVAPLEWESETEWGFKLTPTDSSHSAKMERAGRQLGVIAAIGPQAWKAHAAPLKRAGVGESMRDPVLSQWAAVGDTVLYARYAGQPLFDPMTGQEYYVIHDDDVVAVLPPHDQWVYDVNERDKKL